MSWDEMKILFLCCLIGVLACDTTSTQHQTSPHVVSTSTGGEHGTDHDGHHGTDTTGHGHHETTSYGHHETTSHGHHETTSYGHHETEVPMDHEEPVPLDHEKPVPLGGPPCEECISIRRTPGEPHHLTGEYRHHNFSTLEPFENELLAGDSTMVLNVPPAVPTTK